MRRILIANRGEIARRVIHTARAMGIETVAVYSEPDADALHVREASRAHALGGSTSAESYLIIDKLVEAARHTGADAVHPGYGFLAENADFAQAVMDAGLTWIGPPPGAIRALGSKAEAKALARQAQVPCLPGSEPESQDTEHLAAEAEKIGWPVMIKAVAGGGGRGMRLVTQAGDFAEALRSAKSEALAGFGDDRVLLERALLAPRHVEVQVFADQHGTCIHLGERDCSVQRRNQKIIEEAPSPAVDADMRERMGQSAVMLTKAAGYVGAGTVEFLVEGGEFFLMEMNTRLQVEHTVTEALTGLDLVAWQIRVARGEPLPLTQEQVTYSGHAIEVRLCAEDENFVPCAGEVALFQAPIASHFECAPTMPSVRFDHALKTGLVVTPYYDSMLGKLIVHAPDREAAIGAMIQALGATRVLGLPTNRAFLAACLNHPTFRSGQALVPFLQHSASELRQSLAQQEAQARMVAALSVQVANHGQDGLLPCALERPVRVRHRDKLIAFGLRFGRQRELQVRCGEEDQAWRWLPHVGPGERIRWWQGDGDLAVYAVRGAVRSWHVQTDRGSELWLEDESMLAPDAGQGKAATELRAPFSGRVIRIGADVNQVLRPDDAAVVVDSMKLEHQLSPAAEVRVLEVLVEEGQQLARGQLLMRFELVQ